MAAKRYCPRVIARLSPADVTLTEEKLGSGCFKSAVVGIYAGNRVCCLMLHTLQDPAAYGVVPGTPMFFHQLGELDKEVAMLDDLAAHRHPNLVEVHGVVYAPTTGYPVCIVTELATCTLKDSLEARDLAPHEVNSLGEQLYSALEFMHSIPVMHRDVKPDNIFVFRDVKNDSVVFKLGDFGFSKLDHLHTSMHTLGVGASFYRAPEVTTGTSTDRGYDPRIDVYSATLTLAEAVMSLTARPGCAPLEQRFPPVSGTSFPHAFIEEACRRVGILGAAAAHAYVLRQGAQRDVAARLTASEAAKAWTHARTSGEGAHVRLAALQAAQAMLQETVDSLITEVKGVKQFVTALEVMQCALRERADMLEVARHAVSADVIALRHEAAMAIVIARIAQGGDVGTEPDMNAAVAALGSPVHQLAALDALATGCKQSIVLCEALLQGPFTRPMMDMFTHASDATGPIVLGALKCVTAAAVAHPRASQLFMPHLQAFFTRAMEILSTICQPTVVPLDEQQTQAAYRAVCSVVVALFPSHAHAAMLDPATRSDTVKHILRTGMAVAKKWAALLGLSSAAAACADEARVAGADADAGADATVGASPAVVLGTDDDAAALALCMKSVVPLVGPADTTADVLRDCYKLGIDALTQSIAPASALALMITCMKQGIDAYHDETLATFRSSQEALDVLLRKLDMHAADESVQINGLRVLALAVPQCADVESCKTQVIRRILTGMMRHAKSAAVQRSGCIALVQYMFLSGQHVTAVVSCGALPVVNSALDCFLLDADVQEAACLCLCMLTNGVRGSDVADVGAAERLARSASVHPGNAVIASLAHDAVMPK